MHEMKIEQRHISDQELWDRVFGKYLGKDPIISRNAFAGSAVMLTPGYQHDMKRLCSVLNKACRAIVLNYFEDDRIRRYYQLDQALEDVLKKASGKPYHTGFYRPDLLYDLTGQAKICEIGARYPFNGWMLSYYLELMDRETDGRGREAGAKDVDLADLMDDLYGKLAPAGRIALVHEDEKGTEIFYLQEELARRGLELLSVNPRDLKLEKGVVCSEGLAFLQFILEMDREELRKIDPEVMDKLIEQGACYNDIRTLILVHDKRILAVMYDPEIMGTYLNEEEYLFLRDYLIPSFVITDPKDCDDFIYTEQNLIMKLNSGGRGIGAYIKKECNADEWAGLVRTYWKQYLIQRFVEQKLFDDAENDRRIHLVGMLLCNDERTYGHGLFRGSDETVVNVHQGRALIYAGHEQ